MLIDVHMILFDFKVWIPRVLWLLLLWLLRYSPIYYCLGLFVLSLSPLTFIVQLWMPKEDLPPTRGYGDRWKKSRVRRQRGHLAATVSSISLCRWFVSSHESSILYSLLCLYWLLIKELFNCITNMSTISLFFYLLFFFSLF